MASIQPFDKTTIQTGVRFSIDIVMMIFNTSASFRVYLYDIDDKIIDTSYVLLEGEDYLNWNNDDNYVIQYVANKLGFIIIA